MTIRYPDILSHRCAPQVWEWDERDAIIYALAVGLGSDPLDSRALPFVYEKELKVVPSFPTVLAWIVEPTFEQFGVDPVTALHGEQKIELHRRISAPLKVSVKGSVVDVFDKGSGRGAIVVTRHEIADLADGEPIATLTTTCFGRAEGGCGGSANPAPSPHTVPDRAPDSFLDVPTRADLALLYRLTGDCNPIHAEPAAALAAGFDRPILHGLCSFGITCRAILETYADLDPDRILSHQARFSSPVLPGQTLTVEMWRDENEISFQARVKESGRLALSNGKCVLRKA
jgi:acyl dehydratase